MKELAIFRETAENPHAYAKKYKESTGGAVMGYFCTYTPEEIIHAAGALPFRIFGVRENITLADRHLQAYCCSLVRGGLEDTLSGNLNFLDGTVFPHTCDSIQRLSDIWRLNAGYPVHLDIVLPVKLNSGSAKKYMGGIIKKFRADIEAALNVAISDEALKETVSLYNNIRSLLKELYTMRDRDPSLISGSDVYAIVKSSMVMKRDEFLNHLEAAVTALKKKKKKAGSGGESVKRIILAGGVCNHPDIYDLLEDAGGSVVWDELCTGTRLFEGLISEDGDPMEALILRYYERRVCPAKHSDGTSRGDNLLRIVKEHNAGGVIFLILKFCEPHSFDYPYMKEYLDKEGIPNMLLEIEEQLPPEGQLRTRFETFIDMI